MIRIVWGRVRAHGIVNDIIGLLAGGPLFGSIIVGILFDL